MIIYSIYGNNLILRKSVLTLYIKKKKIKPFFPTDCLVVFPSSGSVINFLRVSWPILCKSSWGQNLPTFGETVLSNLVCFCWLQQLNKLSDYRQDQITDTEHCTVSQDERWTQERQFQIIRPLDQIRSASLATNFQTWMPEPAFKGIM